MVTVDPSTFEAGDTVTVRGTGLEPNFETIIEFNSVTVQVGTVTTDATGSFERRRSPSPPTPTDGPHTITAVCDTRRQHQLHRRHRVEQVTGTHHPQRRPAAPHRQRQPSRSSSSAPSPCSSASRSCWSPGAAVAAPPTTDHAGVRYARNPAVLWRSTSQGPVVLVPGRELPDARSSGLAAVVWEVLDEPLDADALQDEVASRGGRTARTSPPASTSWSTPTLVVPQPRLTGVVRSA